MSACCAPTPVCVQARPVSACPSRASQRSCGGGKAASRCGSRTSRRPASRQSSGMIQQQQQQVFADMCAFHPRQDCCIPKCCPPPYPKCPIGVYVERTKPIRPDRLYESSCAPFDGLTTYRENYYLKCIDRGKSFKPASTFDPSCAKLEGLTTYKEAYTPKPTYPYRKPAWAKGAEFDPSCAKMDGISTYRNDYNGLHIDPPKSLKPESQFDPSCAPLDDKTTYRTNYIPYCPFEYKYAKQPLAKKLTGGDISCAPLDGISTYRADFFRKCVKPAKSLKPLTRPAFSDAKFADFTTYRNDYIPFTFEKCCGPCIPADIYTEMFPCDPCACPPSPRNNVQETDPCPPQVFQQPCASPSTAQFDVCPCPVINGEQPVATGECS